MPINDIPNTATLIAHAIDIYKNLISAKINALQATLLDEKPNIAVEDLTLKIFAEYILETTDIDLGEIKKNAEIYQKINTGNELYRLFTKKIKSIVEGGENAETKCIKLDYLETRLRALPQKPPKVKETGSIHRIRMA